MHLSFCPRISTTQYWKAWNLVQYRLSLMSWWPIFKERIPLTYLEMQIGNRVVPTWLTERCHFFSSLINPIDATLRSCPEWILQHDSGGIYHHLSRLLGQLKPRRYLWPYKPAAEKQCCCKKEVRYEDFWNKHLSWSLVHFCHLQYSPLQTWFKLFCTLKLQQKLKKTKQNMKSYFPPHLNQL